MSQTKAELPRKRRVFSEEFKQDVVRLVLKEDYSFAAAAQAVVVGGEPSRTGARDPKKATAYFAQESL